MNFIPLYLLWLLTFTTGCGCGSVQLVDQEKYGNDLVKTVAQMVEKQLAGCHLVLAATNSLSEDFSNLIRGVVERGCESWIVVDGSSIPSSPLTSVTPTYQQKRQESGLWREGQATCRVLIIDFSTNNIQNEIRVAEWAAVWTQPETRVIGVGQRGGVNTFLLHPALRNTRHALYLVKQAITTYDYKQGVEVWRRCGYCDEGVAGVERLGRWNVTSAEVSGHSKLFRERPESYNGHQFRIVERNYFPYLSWERVSDEPGAVVVHKDALGTRVIRTMSNKLNFTYVVREPDDKQWGLEGEGGNWTGIVGALQREKADLCLDLTVTPKRATVVQYAGAYVDESVVLLSSKPRPLPEYLSLIRPFEWEVWLIVAVCVVVWGATVWFLQKVWPLALGDRVFDLKSALFYSWGIMLEDPPTSPPKNLTGQLLVGWWLAACLIITSSFRSSLISHLVVQGKSPVINTVEELVGREGWVWGTPRMTGALKTVLSTSPDPAMQKLYQEMQTKSIEEGMKLVVGGGFAFVFSNYYMQIMVATRYTDSTGYTPIHISTSKYGLFSGNTFCFRPGAPFFSHFSLTRQRLMEVGLIPSWMDDVINRRVREARREELAKKTDQVQSIVIPDTRDEGQVVLGLEHLLGAFVMLVLGHGLGCLAFIVEQLSNSY